jgi:cytochrome c-type biogenesis protein
MQGKKELGYLGSGLMGILFAGGWSPCLGPIVGSVLVAVGSGDSTPLEGGITLFAYTMGLGVPFLIVAGALDQATGFLRRLQRHMAKIELASGALLILIGFLLMGGVLQDLATLGGTRAREGLTVDAVDKDLLAELIDNTLAGDVEVGLGEGEAAPNFRTQNIRGELVTLEDFQGKVVLLNFWATWCQPCREEMPEFEQAERDYGDRLVVLPVNLEETPEQIVTFAEDEDIDLDFLIDQKGTIHERYNVTGYPTTYIIQPDGTMLFKHPGPITLEQIDDYLEQIEANEAG